MLNSDSTTGMLQTLPALYFLRLSLTFRATGLRSLRCPVIGWLDIFGVLTWKGMVRLIFSPTFLMYFVRSSRGRRIFGCSKAVGEQIALIHCHITRQFFINLKNTSPKGRPCKMNIFFELCLSQTHPWSHEWWQAVTSRQEGCVQQCLLPLPWSWSSLPQAGHAPHTPASRKAHYLPPPTECLESWIICIESLWFKPYFKVVHFMFYSWFFWYTFSEILLHFLDLKFMKPDKVVPWHVNTRSLLRN